MSHKDVEQIISRAVVDEQFRELLFTSPNEALTGHDLTADERRRSRACHARSSTMRSAISSCARLRGARARPPAPQSGLSSIGAASGTTRATRTDLISDAAVSMDGRRGMTARAAPDAGRAGPPRVSPSATDRDRRRRAGEHAVQFAVSALDRPEPSEGGAGAARHPRRILYLTLRFAERIGTSTYAEIVRLTSSVRDLAGDWVFAAALFDSTRLDEAAYVNDILRRGWPARDSKAAREAFIDRLLDVRAQVASRFSTNRWSTSQAVGPGSWASRACFSNRSPRSRWRSALKKNFQESSSSSGAPTAKA